MRSSFRRMHDTLQSGSGTTDRKRTDDGINVIDMQNIFYVHGNILQYPGNIAHCFSSDMKMGKGLALKLNRTYPNMKQDCKLHSYVPIGSSISYFVPHENKHILNLVTKERFYDKPSYYSLSRSLSSLEKQIAAKGITEIALPKIRCGLDGLNRDTVFRLIKRKFVNSNVNVIIYI